MRAAVYERYGPPEVVSVREVPAPLPGKGEVRVRIVATAVTVADARIRASRFPRGMGSFARLAFGITHKEITGRNPARKMVKSPRRIGHRFARRWITTTEAGTTS